MIVRTPVTFRYLRVSVTLCLLMAVGWPAASATGQPLFEGDLACPAGSPSGQQVAHGLLSALTDPTKGDALNTAWEQAEPNIEQQTITETRIHIPDGCNSDVDLFCAGKLAFSHCSFVYADIELHALTGLAPLRFTTDFQDVNQRNVAAHSNRGPDASVITDSVFAPEGHSSTDPAYAIVLPHNGAAGALVIDLGEILHVCGNGFDCLSGPIIQADNDDVYQLDYSSDGMNWTKYGQFPKVSGSGLHTRDIAQITSGVHNPSFTARYVRVFAVSGGATFSVSELKLWNTGSQPISVDKPAVGPRPSQITDGVFAPKGHSSTDTQYAVVLTHETGPAPALVIDLGAVMTICSNGYDCLSAPAIQADNDDVYQFDYSTDGQNWITYPEMFPSVSGSGLQTRNVPQCNARPDLTQPCSATNHNPNFPARYVRVYAVSGGATFAVSELQLWDISSNLVSVGAPTYGPEPFVTNGEFAPEGTAWNDDLYATVLPPCKATSNSICPTSSALTAALLIDLTASFPIDHLVIQADNHQFQVDSSTDGQAWTPLWTVPEVSGSGLRTRTSSTFSGKEARYLRVYGTAGDDDNYSVSELQVFTPQANTAGAYDGGANDGQNFACSYDGLFTTALGVDNGSSVQPFSTLPIQFYVDSVSLNAHCASSTDSGDYNIASAHDRQCSMTLVPPLDYAAPFTDQFQAGYCAPTTAHPQGLEILSYVHFDDNADTSEDNSAIQFDSKDDVFGDQNGSDLQCSDWDSLDAHIPDVLRGLIPAIAAGATKSAVNTILDYHPPNNHVVPFPRDTSQSKPYPPLKCAGALTVGEPPTPSPDNISGLWGRATQVGSATNSATLRLLGRFIVEEPLALDQAVLTVDALLREISAGELVQGPAGSLLVPLSLHPLKGSKPDKGIYRTPPGAWPIVHAQVAPVKGLDAQSGLMEFSLEVERATILGPAGCAGGPPPTAPLTTSFRLVGGSEAPVWVHTTADWQCNGTQLKIP